ncbi:MAG: UDP-N-acetylglucosamine 2-epimerase [Silvanigrellales bacterium]|nr:UDP-N-acetylglucosamine 2-epimerase [Silvanigrellales bacterium]
MIHVVIGTKAQLIKMAPLMLALQKASVHYNFIFTGQHQETINDLRENFSLKAPDVTLHSGKDVTSLPMMLMWILKILFNTIFRRHRIFDGDTSKESVVLVHGDTFSTLLGALMGKVAGMRVGHVESGLRSFNLWHPFPEELTRLAVFRLSDVFYCPGPWALSNVAKYNGEKVDTGYNTLMDALRLATDSFQGAASTGTGEPLCPGHPYCVITIHRFENIFSQSTLEMIVALVERIASKVQAVFILHPVTERRLREFGLMERMRSNRRVELRPRSDYFTFMRLVQSSEFLVSDGGSNQEEAFYMGKPCLLLRRATERQEGMGVNTVLSNYNTDTIDDFLNTYETLSSPARYMEHSPTALILAHLRESQ